MAIAQVQAVDPTRIRRALARHKAQIRFVLAVCAHCGMCASSCFLYETRGRDPKFMPSHKMIHSIGYMFRKRGDVDLQELRAIGDIVWHRCVLCTRCYCPLGVDIPTMIGLARRICREQGVYRRYDEG
jgi:heterodisulfide reductase subunit C